MLVRDLMQNMFLPKKEIFINKIVKVREIDVHLISLTMEEHKNVLWAMYQLPCHLDKGIYSEEKTEYSSNRNEMINNISKKMSSPHIHISEIMIQKQKVIFSSSTARAMSDRTCEGYIHLQHFIEKGMDTTNWNEVDLANIIMVTYEQKESEEFPAIDLSKELDITLKVSKDFNQVLINQPLTLEFGEIEKGKKLYFYDSIEKKNRIFYINKMNHYDIWEEVNRNLEDQLMQVFPKEQIMQVKEQYLIGLEKTCPEGMNLAMLEYETEDDVQLNFYSKEYLDERPAPKTSSVSTMLFKSDRELGSNGFKSRVRMIKPVEKDFNGSIDVELFSLFMEVPEEIITI